jgi:hypothetical protein
MLNQILDKANIPDCLFRTHKLVPMWLGSDNLTSLKFNRKIPLKMLKDEAQNIGHLTIFSK